VLNIDYEEECVFCDVASAVTHVRLFGNFLPLLMLQATLCLYYPSSLLVSQTLFLWAIDGSTEYCAELPSVAM